MPLPGVKSQTRKLEVTSEPQLANSGNVTSVEDGVSFARERQAAGSVLLCFIARRQQYLPRYTARLGASFASDFRQPEAFAKDLSRQWMALIFSFKDANQF